MIEFTARPNMLSIFGRTVHTWGFIVAIGIIIGLVLIYKEAVKKKIKDDIEWFVLWIILLAIVGARLAYISLNPSEFPTLISLINIVNGGLVGWGAIVGGLAGVVVFKLTRKIRNERLFMLLDLIAPYLALMFAIGRIGCFIRGCCFGIPTSLPWGLIYSGNELLPIDYIGKTLHPTQLYHSIADFVIFFALLKLKRKKENLEKMRKSSKYHILNIKGGLFLIFIMLYSAERFIIDFLRYHLAKEYLGRITITQAVYMILFAIAFSLGIKKIKQKRKNY